MQKESLCWVCRRAAGAQQCSWARAFLPVEGWKAVRRDVVGRRDELLCSYRVMECPQFLPDHPFARAVCAECIHCGGQEGKRRVCQLHGSYRRLYAAARRAACAHFYPITPMCVQMNEARR